MAGSQALAFGEFLVGGVLITMGISGKGVRDVLAGKAGSVAPLAGGGGGGQPAPGATGPIGTGALEVKGANRKAQTFVDWANSQLGVKEGSRAQAGYAAAAGVSPAAAWCAAFVTAGLKRLGIRPPADPASVSSWANWSGGEGIGTDLSKARPGDLLRFGGEHIGIYLGGGKMISGNWSNEVGIASVSEESTPLSEIIRVNGLYGSAGKRVARAIAGVF